MVIMRKVFTNRQELVNEFIAAIENASVKDAMVNFAPDIKYLHNVVSAGAPFAQYKGAEITASLAAFLSGYQFKIIITDEIEDGATIYVNMIMGAHMKGDFMIARATSKVTSAAVAVKFGFNDDNQFTCVEWTYDSGALAHLMTPQTEDELSYRPTQEDVQRLYDHFVKGDVENILDMFADDCVISEETFRDAAEVAVGKLHAANWIKKWVSTHKMSKATVTGFASEAGKCMATISKTITSQSDRGQTYTFTSDGVESFLFNGQGEITQHKCVYDANGVKNLMT